VKTWVMAGLVPATPLNKAPPCHMIGVAGTSPAMTKGVFTASVTPSRCLFEGGDNARGKRLSAERSAEVARALRRDRDGRVDRAEDRLSGGGEIGAGTTLLEP